LAISCSDFIFSSSLIHDYEIPEQEPLFKEINNSDHICNGFYYPLSKNDDEKQTIVINARPYCQIKVSFQFRKILISFAILFLVDSGSPETLYTSKKGDSDHPGTYEKIVKAVLSQFKSGPNPDSFFPSGIPLQIGNKYPKKIVIKASPGKPHPAHNINLLGTDFIYSRQFNLDFPVKELTFKPE